MDDGLEALIRCNNDGDGTESLKELHEWKPYQPPRDPDVPYIKPYVLLELLRGFPGASSKIASGSVDELTDSLEELFNKYLEFKYQRYKVLTY